MSDPTPSFPILADPPVPAPLQPVWVIQARRPRWWLHILFFLLTILSTTVVGGRIQAHYLHGQPAFSLDEDIFAPFVTWIRHPSELLRGLSFSFTLMFILLAHEMGHYLFARRYHVYATPPFFIPFTSFIGTLGAFIRIKSPIPSRKALFDIGIAGPIAGFIPACVAVLTGLWLSHPLAANVAPYDNGLGFPLIFQFAARIVHPGARLTGLALHPIAVAGWVGMFATSLNLLPGGQLDGGHILYSVLPKWHRWISLLTVIALVPLAKYCWVGWLLWAVVLWLTSQHPHVPNYPRLSGARKLAAVFAVVMLSLAFTPAPFSEASGRYAWKEVGAPAAEWVKDEVRHRLLHRK